MKLERSWDEPADPFDGKPARTILPSARPGRARYAAAACVDALARYVLDDRFNAFRVQGSALAAPNAPSWRTNRTAGIA
jgi:hypothetical protein